MNKTSLVITILNEEHSLKQLIDSIVIQSQLPDEIIFVDGGSTDKTVSIISNFKSKRLKSKIKIFIKKGNRSIGRNFGIKKAAGSIILITDAGCILDKNWVKEITKPFHDASVSVVAGFYKTRAKTFFQKCLTPFVLIMPDRVNPSNFLPASRSMAFRKSLWKNQKFDEKLSHNEDYKFAKNLNAKKINIFFQKKAIVNWIPRTDLHQAFVMFFRFALGDAESKLLRPKVIFIFVRYVIFLSILSLSSIFTTKHLNILVVILLVLYITWSIAKNIRYVGPNIKALFWLPILQVTSDIAVMLGTVAGLWKILNPVKIIRNNLIVTAIIATYSLLVLSGIDWGIPNSSHPFAYHMDEWANAQSVRYVFKYGSPNINGASHGAIFQYFLGGIFLVPFILLHIVNPFVIKNSLEHIDMQHRLFEVLRLNTLTLGILSIVSVAVIAKKYLKTNPVVAAGLFTFTPIFVMLSNYFKYDIATTFWITFSLLSAYWFSQNPTKKRFFVTSIVSALAMATKVSAAPTIIMLIASFFLFYPKPKKNVFILGLGLVTYAITFLLFGIPDLFFQFKEYSDWWKINVITDPNTFNNFRLGMPYWAFLFLIEYPVLFGRGFALLFYGSIISSVVLSFRYLFRSTFNVIEKREIFLTISFFAFVVSVIPLKFDASGNRMTVFLSFLALMGSIALHKIYSHLTTKKRVVSIIFFSAFVLFQFALCTAWISIRIFPDIRSVSSNWILGHIPRGTTIGLLNPPIFESAPDFLLKEYYSIQYFPSSKTYYKYQAYDGNTKKFPKIMILNNIEYNVQYIKKISRNDIYYKLQNQGYVLIARFTPDFQLFKYFGNETDFGFSGLVAVPNSISIFEKK